MLNSLFLDELGYYYHQSQTIDYDRFKELDQKRIDNKKITMTFLSYVISTLEPTELMRMVRVENYLFVEISRFDVLKGIERYCKKYYFDIVGYKCLERGLERSEKNYFDYFNYNLLNKGNFKEIWVIIKDNF